jgi:hypothetical protein
MAVVFVRNHTAQLSTTSNTAINMTIQATVASGNLIRVWVGFDNTGTSTPTVSSIAKPAGEVNSWVKVTEHASSTATPNAGMRGEMWCIATTVAWPATTYAITFSATITAKTAIVDEFSGCTTTLRGTAGTGTATGGSPTSTTGGTAPVTGDLVLGGAAFESNAVPTGDADTSNGSWSTANAQATSSGGATANCSVIGQYKIVTGGGHQTYNPTRANDCGSCVVALIPTVFPDITQAAYRFYADGTESGSTAVANQSTAYSADVTGGDVNLQLRIRLQSTSATAITAADLRLEYECNVSGSWGRLIDSFSVTPHNSSNVTDGAATTNRLTGGTNSFVAGVISTDGLAASVSWSGNNYTELLFPITIKQYGASTSTIRFRITTNGVPTGYTYSSTPTIDVTGPASPAVVTTTSGNSGAVDATSHTVTMPDGVTVGDLLVVFFGHDGTAAASIGSGTNWKRTSRAFATGNACTLMVFFKVADGSDGLTVTTDAAEQSAYISYRISGANYLFFRFAQSGVANAEPLIYTQNIGLYNISVPVWLVARIADGASTGNATAAPTGYTNLVTQAGSGANGVCLAVAEKAGTVDSFSEDPAAFTNAAAPSVMLTCMVAYIATAGSTTTPTDAFDTFDDRVWSTSLSDVVPYASGGKLVLGPSITTGVFYSRVESKIVYDLTGSSVVVEVPDIGTTQTQVNLAATPLRLHVPMFYDSTGNDTVVYFRIPGTGNALDCRYRSSSTPVTNAASVTYSAVDHRWLKISESGGTVFWWGSPDGITWTQIGSLDQASWPIGWYPDKVSIGMGFESTASSTTPTSVQYDNFNLAPSGAVLIRPNIKVANLALSRSFSR